MNKFGILILLQFLTLGALAQQKSVEAGAAMRTDIGGTYLGTFEPQAGDIDLLPELKGIRQKVNKSQNQEDLARYKDSLNKIKAAAQVLPERFMNKTTASVPSKVSGFNTIANQGTPSDNSIAIGKDGKMIVAVNSSLRVYNKNGSSVGLIKYFVSFWGSVTNANSLCDPVVYYDTDADRFIIFTQVCDRVTTDNRILMAFSATNDPAGSYHFYSFRANLREVIGTSYPVDVWFDYPKMATSQSDVFVSGNMFRNTSSTTSAFVESALFQIDKSDGFAGNSNIAATVFNNISGSPFTLVPAGYGRDGNYGDVMHLASTRNFTTSNSIRMFTVTNNVRNNPTISTALVSVPNYSQPADGVQPVSLVKLNTGDVRGMSAMYVDGTVHFVFHCDGPNNYVAINYHRLRRSGNSWVSQNQLISFPGVDCAYPAIASLGYSDQDQAALIVFDYSNTSEYPGMGAVYIDDNFTPSGALELKDGTHYVSYGVDGQGRTRWGDYSGIAREHNASTPTVWGFGMYGSSGNNWSNYVAEVRTNGFPLETKRVEQELSNVRVFPNPIVDTWSIELNIKKQGELIVDIFDIQGRKIKDLYSARVGTGTSLFSFNKNGLANGTYLLKVTMDGETIANEKINVAK